MESQFGIANVWIQGDFVTRAVAILLLGMSLASWIVILIKALDIIKFKKHARAAQDFWHSEDFAAGMTKLGNDATNPFRHLALEGREATAHHRNTKAHLHDSLDVSDWVTRCLRNCIDEFTARLQSGLAILASVGSTAPFIGLLALSNHPVLPLPTKHRIRCCGIARVNWWVIRDNPARAVLKQFCPVS